MKKLLYIILFGSLLIIMSCGGEEPSKVKEPYNESRELVPNPEGYKKDTSIVTQSDSTLNNAKLKPEN